MRTHKFLIGLLVGVHASGIVNKVIRTNLSLFIFIFTKILERTKTEIKPKHPNKTKTTTKTTVFYAQKLLRRKKLFILPSLKKRKWS